MTNGWTPARRKRQAELIRQWRPWEKSTGPLTAKGRRERPETPHKGVRDARYEIWRGLLRENGRQSRRLPSLKVW
jgi:hypothetical protein